MTTLKDDLEDATAVFALPGKYRPQLWTTSVPQRLIEKVRQWEKVICIFPNVDSAWRLIGAVLAKRHEELPGRAGSTSTWLSSATGRSERTGPNLNPTIQLSDNE